MTKYLCLAFVLLLAVIGTLLINTFKTRKRFIIRNYVVIVLFVIEIALFIWLTINVLGPSSPVVKEKQWKLIGILGVFLVLAIVFVSATAHEEFKKIFRPVGKGLRRVFKKPKETKNQ